MGTRTRVRVRTRHTTVAAVAAVAAVLGLAPGCTITGAGDGKAPSAGGRVLAVKIDNVGPARPQTGLDAADVVYAEQVEAGLSRLMAVYAGRLPPVIGPVRSARETDLELLRQFDDPALAFSGAQSKLLPLISDAPLRPLSPGKAPGDAYFRGGAKPAPHNLFVRPKALDARPGGGGLESTGFVFGPRPKGGTPERERTVRFPAARFTFTWSAGQERWLVSMDGQRSRTSDGKPLAASTVVVQYVQVRQSRFHDRSGNITPFTETVGSGEARVLRDGRAYKARWQRPSPDDGTEFTTADGGKRLPFAKGQVWVVYAKA
ncbi:hypothetical protein GCM10010277_19700 [Streptomyces longisporoflavus]|uniref:DUF3048 domain-containing protein n=1 Tax=Streptomyces longisporoflavus TaxID=28044 RepID=UPI00167CFEE9|nr:DUF3048 domain-containing protein [Streptomyces longisporoflavus]GGV34438.1 hypothetical protein GCM10010277_19700 [Streptomyces longisporoflavus]